MALSGDRPRSSVVALLLLGAVCLAVASLAAVLVGSWSRQFNYDNAEKIAQIQLQRFESSRLDAATAARRFVGRGNVDDLKDKWQKRENLIKGGLADSLAPLGLDENVMRSARDILTYAEALATTDGVAIGLAAAAFEVPADQLPEGIDLPATTGYTRTELGQQAVNMLENEAYFQMRQRYQNSVKNFNQYLRDWKSERIEDVNRTINVAVIGLVLFATIVPIVLVIRQRQRRRHEERLKIIISLGESISGVTSPIEAAQLISEAAHQLMGWDACFIDLYEPADETVKSLLSVDRMDGESTNVRHTSRTPVSTMYKKTLREGPQLILRKSNKQELEVDRTTVMFGNTQRRSASLMYVPIHRNNEIIGVMSVQSYSYNAYNASDLSDLQWLADRCGMGLERAQLYEQLQQSEERYKAVIENNVDGVFLVQDRRYVFVNRPMALIFGYEEPHQILALANPAEIAVAEDRAFVSGLFERIVNSRVERARVVFSGNRRDNRRTRIELVASSIMYDGKPAVLGALTDVSDRERARDAEKRVRGAYTRAIEAVGAIPYLLDFASQTYEFLGGNVEELTGYSGRELNKDLFSSRVRRSVIYDDARNLNISERREAMLSGKLEKVRADYEFQHKDGRYIWLADASTTSRDENGRIVGTLGILMDITFRKRAEERSTTFALLGQQLSDVRSAPEAARVISDTADRLFAWDACNINSYDGQRDLLVGLYNCDIIGGTRREVETVKSASTPSDFGRIILTQGPRLVLRKPGEASTELRTFGDVTRRSASLMFAPMLRNGSPIGYLSFQSYKYNTYTPDDLRDLVALADHCAAGLERARLYERLEQSEELFRTVWERAGSGMRLTDERGIIHNVNPAFCEIVGKSRDELIGQPFTVYFETDRHEVSMEHYMERFHNRSLPTVLEREFTLWNGKKVILHVTNSLITTSNGMRLLGVFRDLTPEKQYVQGILEMAKDMETLASTDGLTGVLNRRAFFDAIGRAALSDTGSKARPVLLILDIDFFKKINDTYGHLAGDDVLVHMGRIMRDFARPDDTVGRIGGEEFALLMRDANLGDARQMAERLRQQVESETFHTRGHNLRLTISVGLAQMDERITSTETLYAHADRALYKSKTTGRNRVTLA